MSKQKTIKLAAVGPRSRWLALSCVVVGVCLLAARPAAASSPTPGWGIIATSHPTNFSSTEAASYLTTITNVGSGPTDGSDVTVTDTLPNGVTPTGCPFIPSSLPSSCVISGQTVTTTFTGTFEPGQLASLSLSVEVAPTVEGTVINTVSVSGGGAPTVTSTEPTLISSTDAPFGLASFSFPEIFADGTPDTQAGSHPYSLTTNITFNTKADPGVSGYLGDRGTISGDAKDVLVDPPLGLIGNPQAIPKCTQEQFREQICPASSQIGLSRVVFAGGFTCEGCGNVGPLSTAVYNMVPPPGVPAQFAFAYDVGGIHVRTRLNAHVHSGGDYGLTVAVRGISQVMPLLEIPVTLWGVPADPSHDDQRCKGIDGYQSGLCTGTPGTNSGPNPFTAPPKPFLTVPTACPGTPLRTAIEADSWQEPGNFDSKESTQPALEGCGSLDFSPSLKARPTTNVADSPSGLNVDLHLPAHEGCEEEAGGEIGCENAEAELKDAKVTLPEGLVINPSGANGLDGCSAAEIGYKPGTSAPAEFSPGPAECPDTSRIGTVKVKTQLLDHPLPGSVYLARPYDNPFGSLLAIYIAIYDPASGVVVKLPGHVETDPSTGRLTTTFEENPQLPFEDFELEFFKGATAPLMTPPTCGSYATSSALASWAGQSASPGDKYVIDHSPGGGSCASTAGDLPNAPGFSAGTVTPIAAAFSPLVLNLRREDGSQRLSVIETTMPEGLLGKLAGVPYCPQAAIDAAGAKSGREEQASPSCPSASQVGSVAVGAGAGPAPYYVSGKVYLAGPYEGAPLSLAVITPAVAGPFDLGTVVTRVALHVDPATAQITAKSDPLPSVLKAGGDGFPLDIRSIALKIDRPSFTLNPTSCDPMAVGGSSVSTLGQAASLSDRFQVAECGRLGFKPKLSLRLTGKTNRAAHPALLAVLTMPSQGQANIASAAVTLPHSEFLDQAHIGTICTRVQFAEGSVPGEKCPAASVYGRARAFSPLLEAPLEGPVYLRSSSHTLPDLVAALNGQIQVDLDGRIDSVHGGIRTTFEAVPDAPVSKFVLEMAGGKKGLLRNSTNICRGTHRANAEFVAHNGKSVDLKPTLRDSKCGKAGKHGKHGKHGKRHH
ncbi:MAG TPA: hypothetical protein VFN85_06240 [Solirubrobacterales bacterium]|nr:hypothetical protein [Solirubrobacterales bacterium]